MNKQECNGWTNYETWNVKLWMDNEEGSNRYWNEEARRTLRHEADRDDAIIALADQLKEEHEEALPELPASFVLDLLNAAMSEVNWYEIAKSLIEDNADEDEEETETEEAEV